MPLRLFQIHFVLLISRQGKVRLTKWYSPYSQKERTKVWVLGVGIPRGGRNGACAQEAWVRAVGVALHLWGKDSFEKWARILVKSNGRKVLATIHMEVGILSFSIHLCWKNLSWVILVYPKRNCTGREVIRELSGVILTRGPKLCNFVEWRGYKVVYKRYASLYFCMCIDQDDNELEVLEIIHHFVEILDRYFGSVCELDLIFNFHKVCLLNPPYLYDFLIQY
ncbi:AP-1 complex subunit sigma-2 [Vitis vinifera]|uniref:AP-1 complex subunit sigma-2 n=1 Tax=Vitis vinifera TaxID=29760 RepID=A0A438JNL1_VITVI|nr:AP-1 complex subunit sigma-2 [Vitis vinifera]